MDKHARLIAPGKNRPVEISGHVAVFVVLAPDLSVEIPDYDIPVGLDLPPADGLPRPVLNTFQSVISSRFSLLML